MRAARIKCVCVTCGESHNKAPCWGWAIPVTPQAFPLSHSISHQHIQRSFPRGASCASQKWPLQRAQSHSSPAKHIEMGRKGKERKPERQKLSSIISVSKALPKTEIKLRAPASKPKSLFLGLDKIHDNWLQIWVQPENQDAAKLLDPHGRSNVMNNYADSEKGNQALNPEQSLTLPSQVA